MTDTTELAPVTTEPAFGREGLERDAGLVPFKDETKAEPQDDLTKDEAAQRLRELSGPESAIITHTTGLPPNVTLTTDQAAEMLAEARGADRAQAELDDTQAQQAEIDKLRGEKPAEAQQPQIETEIDVDRALASPKVRDAIAERVTAAETQRTQHEAAVAQATNFAVASLFGDFPEFENLPTTEWVNAIQSMPPGRAHSAISKLQALGRVEAANQQIKAEKTAREQVEFRAYAAKENARFAEMTKGIPAKEMARIEAHIPKMLNASGADVQQFLTAVSNQSTFPRATAEALLVKAARYDLLMETPKPVPAPAPLPPVQRPGTAAPGGAARGDTNLQALSAKLSRSGSLKDAAALLAAKRSKGR
ncbi:hypothetical protein H8B02_11730 [Bradyrhizobium sp. Pear77]|uniref:hypothetical protein n=1 Tax=Bradyrhizobium altum TaxID=1571202 RepID=UPI001E650F0F|nr:hypothetical protein [Bradyrhizobium altum]MCC8954106.1 hypothetical protein [Bradyrhizobium altum]